ncbi:Uncharacterised protein [Neisseria animaloris]|uniref:hypothetical protein n=1 Tax=Neisseria TaxID=482 RepID=UPI0007C9DA25|nr:MULTISPECIES: hypothetical protein [Neisseria]OSI07070.1 hypothetical protein BWD08_09355 [Neisseria animaloris]SAY51339.1 Uncharacterised protein [Neisseria weaveri]VEH88199.1 Uncharacterised protein [Neisseria animaloris]
MAAAQKADPIWGNKLYQQRARIALPILIRQAGSQEPILYSNLALEMGMPNPRNLDYVLGCIGKTIECLNEKNEQEIPPIQSLVVNKHTGLPGGGIGDFLIKDEDFSKLSLKRRRDIVQAELQRIYIYPKWHELLEALGLSEAQKDFSKIISEAANFRGTGEGEEHKKLKEYIANRPELFGINAKVETQIEYRLPSGDSLDVSFRNKSIWVAVEVKPSTAAISDITRGIFQCVKYRAVLDAVLIAENEPQNSRAVLALGGDLPEELIPLVNLLGVEFIQNVKIEEE